MRQRKNGMKKKITIPKNKTNIKTIEKENSFFSSIVRGLLY